MAFMTANEIGMEIIIPTCLSLFFLFLFFLKKLFTIMRWREGMLVGTAEEGVRDPGDGGRIGDEEEVQF